MYNYILDFIFPPICIVSNQKLNKNNSNRYIEDSIFNSLQKLSSNDLDQLNKKVNAEYCFSLYEFHSSNEIQTIIHQIKYNQIKSLGVFLGEILGSHLNNFLNQNKLYFDILIPIPLHKSRLRERGYNQSSLLCKGITKTLNIEFNEDIISRNKNTQSQAKLDQIKRSENIKNAFFVKNNSETYLKDKSIIIVDDVITTGSTINELIKVLKQKEVKNILAVSLAMAKY